MRICHLSAHAPACHPSIAAHRQRVTAPQASQSNSVTMDAPATADAAPAANLPVGGAPAGAASPAALSRTAFSRLNLAPGAQLRSSMLAATPAAADSGFAPASRVAYQGEPGAYSEMAAGRACPGWEPLPCEQFETAFQALSQWMADRAVLPVENSLGGSIHAVYDLLLRYRLHIVGETSVAVNHCLLALPGVKKSDIRRVMSHPQALAQTDGYTRRMGAGVVREAVDDTAGAAKAIAEHGWRDAAAVASRRAAELYGLEVLDEGIQDMKDNVTRFIVLSRDPLVAPAADQSRFKTSIVFSLKEGPGMLFKALSVFALRDVDLTKIESRPLRTDPLILSGGTGGDDADAVRAFNYLFYVDFAGSLADPACQNALRHLQEIAPFLRVLGSYPRDLEL
jgi:arogenate/prephenate dehydratase